VVVFLETIVLVGLAFARFEASKHLSAGLDPTVDPLVSMLGWIEVVVWLAAPLLIGVLVARTARRTLAAAGLAFAAVASAVVASPLLQQLVVFGPALLESGQTPPHLYFAPPAGWSQGYAVPLLIAIGVVVAGGVAATEAALVAELANRFGRVKARPAAGTEET
jgi:hypothetical protein